MHAVRRWRRRGALARWVGALVVAGVIAAVFALPAAQAAPKPGSACKAKEVGRIVPTSATTGVRCERRDNAYRWNRVTKAEIEREEKQGGGSTAGTTQGSAPAASCSTRPKFTHDVIAVDHVRVASPIGGQEAFGGSPAKRSYVHARPELVGQKLPLYAPTDLTVTTVSFYKSPHRADDPSYKGEYALWFDAGCGIEVQLYHVKGLVGRVARVAPKEPTVGTSAGRPVTPTPVKAGEQIGWARGEAGIVSGSAGIDFVVLDHNHTNTFINQKRFLTPHARDFVHVICPFSLYVGAKRKAWLAKLGPSGGEPIPGTPCGVISQGTAGTAQGWWFFPDAQLTEFTYRGKTWNEGWDTGQYQSQVLFVVDPGGAVRIGGLNAERPMGQLIVGKVGAGGETWRDPLTVTGGQEHCWSNGERSVKVRLSARGDKLTAVVGVGACSTLSLADGVTYVR